MDVKADSRCTIKADNQCRGSQTLRQKELVSLVYSSVDEAANSELHRLNVEEGVVSACKPGCFQCCGQHILTNIAEARVLTQYIQQEFSSEQIEELRIRTELWHKWDENRPARLGKNQASEQNCITHHYCPMLVEGECSAYPMRPLICRTHFVSSDPPTCHPFYDSKSKEGNPKSLESILTVTNHFSLRIREFIEKTGFNFYRSIMLLPHWLAIEMNWDFTISPKMD
jgi:Fe-S-cluster containining protein